MSPSILLILTGVCFVWGTSHEHYVQHDEGLSTAASESHTKSSTHHRHRHRKTHHVYQNDIPHSSVISAEDYSLDLCKGSHGDCASRNTSSTIHRGSTKYKAEKDITMDAAGSLRSSKVHKASCKCHSKQHVNTSTNAKARELVSNIDKFVRSVFACHPTTALSLAVVKDGQVLLNSGYGRTSVKGGQKVTSKTRFPIGSLTKAFTATLIAKWINEQENITLDTPIREFYPAFQVSDDMRSSMATYRDLLGHRMGIPSFFLPLLMGIPLEVNREDLVKRLAHIPSSVSFRERFVYNNYMYLVAAHVLEKMNQNTTWEEMVAEQLLRPLNMSGSGFFRAVMDMPEVGASVNSHYTLSQLKLGVRKASKKGRSTKKKNDNNHGDGFDSIDDEGGKRVKKNFEDLKYDLRIKSRPVRNKLETSVDNISINDTNTAFGVDSPFSSDFAFGCAEVNGTVQDVPPELLTMVSPCEPAGSIYSNAEDMAKWMSFLLSGGQSSQGKQVIDPKVILMTWEPSVAVVVDRDWNRPWAPISHTHHTYNLGWITANYRGYRQLFHTGGIATHTSRLWLFPDVKAGIFLSINGPQDKKSTLNLHDSIMYYLTDELLGKTHWFAEEMSCAGLPTFTRPVHFPSGTSNAKVSKSLPHSEANQTSTVELHDPPKYALEIKSFEGSYRHECFGTIEIFKVSNSHDEQQLLFSYGRFGRLFLNRVSNVEFEGLYEEPLHIFNPKNGKAALKIEFGSKVTNFSYVDSLKVSLDSSVEPVLFDKVVESLSSIVTAEEAISYQEKCFEGCTNSYNVLWRSEFLIGYNVILIFVSLLLSLS